MNTEEKELLKKLLNEAERKGISGEEINYVESSNGEIDDEKMVNEVKQSMEFLAFTADVLGRKGTPTFIKKWIKILWYHIKKAIANFLREVACEIDPDCK